MRAKYLNVWLLFQTYVEIQLHAPLTSALHEGEWSASRPGRFTTSEKRLYTLDRRLGGPQNRSGRVRFTKQITEDEMGGACSKQRNGGHAYTNLVGKPECKRPFPRRRHRWNNNISEDWGGKVWAQDRDQWRALVNTIIKLWVTWKPGNFLSERLLASQGPCPVD
jgi:hypothetical protein